MKWLASLPLRIMLLPLAIAIAVTLTLFGTVKRRKS